MTGPSSVFLVVAAVFAVGDWWAVAGDDGDGIRRPVEYVCKPATLVALVATAAGLHAFDDGVQAWFVVALALSLVGDVLLMLPTDHFVDGLAAFLSAHLAYIVGLRLSGGSAPDLLLAAAPVVVAALIVGRRIVLAVRGGGHPELTAPVTVYMAVISVMVTTALACGRPLAAVGAGLFYVSDALIAWNRFVRPLPQVRLAIMVTYHLAQGALTLSLLR